MTILEASRAKLLCDRALTVLISGRICKAHEDSTMGSADVTSTQPGCDEQCMERFSDAKRISSITSDSCPLLQARMLLILRGTEEPILNPLLCFLSVTFLFKERLNPGKGVLLHTLKVASMLHTHLQPSIPHHKLDQRDLEWRFFPGAFSFSRTHTFAPFGSLVSHSGATLHFWKYKIYCTRLEKKKPQNDHVIFCHVFTSEHSKERSRWQSPGRDSNRPSL
jgi:hypothetical protein